MNWWLIIWFILFFLVGFLFGIQAGEYVLVSKVAVGLSGTNLDITIDINETAITEAVHDSLEERGFFDDVREAINNG